MLLIVDMVTVGLVVVIIIIGAHDQRCLGDAVEWCSEGRGVSASSFGALCPECPCTTLVSNEVDKGHSCFHHPP